MLAGTVYTNMINTLKNNPALKKYMKNVYKGLRTEMDVDSLPCVILEPVQNNEIDLDMNQFKNIWFTVDVIGFSYTPIDTEKSIVGDKDYKGVLDIEQDIKACLQSSNTLGDTVIDLQFEPSTFDRSNFPNRGVIIPVKVLYRQEDNV